MIAEETYYRAAAELTTRNLRELFNGADPDQFKDPLASLDQEQRKAYVAQIGAVMPAIEAVLKALAAVKYREFVTNTATMQQLVFNHGEINFSDVLLAEFRKIAAEHQANLERSRAADTLPPSSPVPSIAERG